MFTLYFLDIDLAKIVKALQILVKSFAAKSFEHWRNILLRGAPLTLHQERFFIKDKKFFC